MSIPHQDCSKTTNSLFHQFCYQGKKSRSSEQTWLSKNPTKINSFFNKIFDTSFWTHMWEFPTKIAQKPWLHFFTNFATKAQKVNLPNLDKPKPNQDQFLSQPNFSHLILHAFLTIPTKIAQKPWLHFFTNFATKPQKFNPPNLAKPKPNQDQFLLQPNFWHLILDAFVTIPHQDCSKSTTSLFHQFCYQGTNTRPSDQTWLSQNPTNSNSFCNQTFDTSFWMHLRQFPTKISPNPWLHFFTNFATKVQKLGQATKHG